MKLYEVNAKDGEPSITYRTKREAITAAGCAARDYAPDGEMVEVDEITLDRIDKALIVRLINNAGGYVIGRRTVFTLRAIRPGAARINRDDI